MQQIKLYEKQSPIFWPLLSHVKTSGIFLWPEPVTWWAHGSFQKKICGISTYDNWNFKPWISSIFHFDRASDGWVAHVLGVNAFIFGVFQLLPSEVWDGSRIFEEFWSEFLSQKKLASYDDHKPQWKKKPSLKIFQKCR